MSPILEIIFMLIACVAALAALHVKDLLVATVVLGAYSFMMALLYASLGAIDVGFNEAVVGAGVTGIFMIMAIFHLDRRSLD